MAIELKTTDGSRASNTIDIDSGFQICKMNNEETISAALKDIRLYPDKCLLGLYAGDITSSVQFDWIQDCISINILDGGKRASRSLPRHAGLLVLTPD